MNDAELEEFKELLVAFDQSQRLQRMREGMIKTNRQYLWKVVRWFNRCPDDLSAVRMNLRTALIGC